MRSSNWLVAASLVILNLGALSTGCAAHVTRAAPATAAASTGNVQVSEDIARACMIKFNAVPEAPKFGFDQSGLRYDDHAILDQLATCVTTGPLKGRSLELVGHADPRGESEYNLALGSQRASTVGKYLQTRGVDQAKLAQTSRGELDAAGTDAESWERDRRVDVLLP